MEGETIGNGEVETFSARLGLKALGETFSSERRTTSYLRALSGYQRKEEEGVML